MSLRICWHQYWKVRHYVHLKFAIIIESKSKVDIMPSKVIRIGKTDATKNYKVGITTTITKS
jgi:hypothetical protein